jgi:hypothetical protein
MNALNLPATAQTTLAIAVQQPKVNPEYPKVMVLIPSALHSNPLDDETP